MWSIPAHPGEPLEPHDLWRAWNTELWLLVPLIICVVIYLWGVRKLWQRAGISHGISMRRLFAFVLGMSALFVALVSPLDAMGGALFSAHMAQHLILVLVAAPLLVLSHFPTALLAALPRRRAQAVGQGVNRSHGLTSVWQRLNSPVTAWFLFATAMWAWHAPAFYETALRNDFVHDIEHLTFLLTAMLFWWVLLRQTTQKHVRYAIAIPYLFTTMLHSGLLGALMTFTTKPWYAYYADRVAPWGLTPLQDQQLAGLIMWIPGGAVLTLLTIGYFAAWLRALEHHTARSQARDVLQARQEPH